MPEQVAVERRRGGNRLPVGHPARGRPPVYQRCRALPVDPEPWRNKRQRERTRRALGRALERGELPARLVPVLEAMLELADPCCDVTWHSRAKIGRAAGGLSERTVGGHLAELRQLGWVARRHRFVVEEGRLRGTSNLWRIDIPEGLRAELAEAEARKATDTRRRRQEQKRGRVTPPGGPARQGRRAGYAQRPDFSPAFDAGEADELAATDAAVQEIMRTAQPDDPGKRAEAPRLAEEIRARHPALRQAGRSPP